jgi:hypothetical protein
VRIELDESLLVAHAYGPNPDCLHDSIDARSLTVGKGPFGTRTRTLRLVSRFALWRTNWT